MLINIFEKNFFNNSVLEYLIAIATILTGIIAVKIFKKILLNYLKKLASKTATMLDDFLIITLEKTIVPIFYYGVFYIAAKEITLPAIVDKIINVTGVSLITFLAIRGIINVINFWFDNYLLKEGKTRVIGGAETKSFRGILIILKTVIWGFGLTFLLDNLGFNISAVVAGLGIGGIAVALAAQAILGDLFSYFCIFFDKPFEIGDFIILGDYLGAVEYVGIKTTRIRSLSGEQLVFSNTYLTNTPIRNYKRMERRRVVFKFGVIYQTSAENTKLISELIKEIIMKINNVEFDRAHFFAFGDFSLIYEVVYYVKTGDYNQYMDIQQEINLSIKNEFEKRGIEFAYPTQTILKKNT